MKENLIALLLNIALKLLKTSWELKQRNCSSSYFQFKYNNILLNASDNTYFLITALTVTYSFIIIIIICCVENKWIMSKISNMPHTCFWYDMCEQVQKQLHVFPIQACMYSLRTKKFLSTWSNHCSKNTKNYEYCIF